MGINIDVSRTENEASAQLERILAQPVLPKTSRPSSLPGQLVIAAEYVEDVPTSQAHRSIGFSAFINQQWERDAGFLAEYPGIVHVAQPDRRQTGAFFVECRLVLAQLRDVLAAEESTIMAQEGHYTETLGPQRPELDLLTLAIRQYDPRQLFTE